MSQQRRHEVGRRARARVRLAYSAAAISLAAGWTGPASGASRFWVGGSGFWNLPANWSATAGGAGGATVPVGGDSATISLSSTITVTRDVTTPSYATPLNQLVLQGTGGASVTLNQSANNLLVNDLYLTYGFNTISQINLSGGVIQANYFNCGLLDNNVGTVNLSGTGSFSVGDMFFSDWVNTQGTFNQSGGTFTASGGARLASSQSTSKATYNLSAGSFSAASLTVGASGAATFNQTGGTANVGTFACGVGGTGTMLIGGLFNSGAGVSTVGPNGRISGAVGGLDSWSVGGSLVVDGGVVDLTNLSFIVDTSPGNQLVINNNGTFKKTLWTVTTGNHAVQVNSGTFDCADTITLGGASTFLVNGGQVNAATISADSSHFFLNSGTVNLTGASSINLVSTGL